MNEIGISIDNNSIQRCGGLVDYSTITSFKIKCLDALYRYVDNSFSTLAVPPISTSLRGYLKRPFATVVSACLVPASTPPSDGNAPLSCSNFSFTCETPPSACLALSIAISFLFRLLRKYAIVTMEIINTPPRTAPTIAPIVPEGIPIVKMPSYAKKAHLDYYLFELRLRWRLGQERRKRYWRA